jgi:hypothetical protein
MDDLETDERIWRVFAIRFDRRWTWSILLESQSRAAPW